MKKAVVNEIFLRLSHKMPNPRIELDYTNHYELLVAVILSAQSTDKGVNRVTPNLFAVANTPEQMVALGIDALKEHIKTIGLYNNKALNIIKMSEQLLSDHKGEVPNNMEALLQLAGVGRKSANVILNSLFGMPTIAVDTHVFRVANRLGLTKNSKTPEETERKLVKIVPKHWLNNAHHWLVLHGRYTCIARKPKCEQCLLIDLCRYSGKTCSK